MKKRYLFAHMFTYYKFLLPFAHRLHISLHTDIRLYLENFFLFLSPPLSLSLSSSLSHVREATKFEISNWRG